MSPRVVRLVLFAVLCSIWGSTWLVIKKSLVDLPPLTSAAARMSVAAVFMVVFTRPLQALSGGRRSPAWLSFVLGLCQFTISFAIIYVCERVLPSGLCAVLWAIYPLIVALLGRLFVASERLRAMQWVGFVTGFAGIVLLFSTDVRRIGGAAPWAATLLLVSPVVVAISTLAIKKHGAGVSSVLMNRDALCLAAVMLWGLALAFERGAPCAWTAQALLAVAYLAVLGTVTTFCIYFWLMQTYEAWRMSLVSYVTPALSLLLQASFEDQPVRRDTVWGLATILTGVALATVGGSIVGRRLPPTVDQDQSGASSSSSPIASMISRRT